MSKRLASVQRVVRRWLRLVMIGSAALTTSTISAPRRAEAGDAPTTPGISRPATAPFNAGWLITLVQAATPPSDRPAFPATGPGTTGTIPAPVLKPLPPIDPSEQADLLAAWRRTVQNAPPATPTVTPAPVNPTGATPAPINPTTAATPAPVNQPAAAPPPANPTGAAPAPLNPTAAATPAPVDQTAAAPPPVNPTGAALVPLNPTAAAPPPVSSAALPAPVSQTEAAAPSDNGSVQGVSANEIRFGMSSAFSGAAREIGHNLMIGVETAFGQANDAGGIYGRQLKLLSADDGYEPTRTADTMKKLYNDDKVFGYICNFGTATAAVAAPFALEHKMLFFGAFTGSPILRHDPPDRYVFNYRAASAEETAATLRYLVMVRRFRPDQIVVFAQEDGFGDAGYDGVQKELRRLYGGRAADVVRLGYKRNTVDVTAAVSQVMAHRKALKAVIMVATYRAAAKFIEKTRDDLPDLIYTNISGVGSTSLADELVLLGPKYASGVIVTQIVPAVDSYATAILDYKAQLAKYFPDEKPDYVSLEGYISANLLIDGIKRAGPQLDTEKLVDALETMKNIDMGLGTPLNFGLTEHQASHKIWATVLDGTGHYKALDLE